MALDRLILLASARAQRTLGRAEDHTFPGPYVAGLTDLSAPPANWSGWAMATQFDPWTVRARPYTVGELTDVRGFAWSYEDFDTPNENEFLPEVYHGHSFDLFSVGLLQANGTTVFEWRLTGQVTKIPPGSQGFSGYAVGLEPLTAGAELQAVSSLEINPGKTSIRLGYGEEVFDPVEATKVERVWASVEDQGQILGLITIDAGGQHSAAQVGSARFRVRYSRDREIGITIYDGYRRRWAITSSEPSADRRWITYEAQRA